jgi:hypothetical protein
MGRLRLSARIKRDMEKETRREIGGRTGVNRLVYVHVIEQPGPSAHSLGHLEIGCSRYPGFGGKCDDSATLIVAHGKCAEKDLTTTEAFGRFNKTLKRFKVGR